MVEVLRMKVRKGTYKPDFFEVGGKGVFVCDFEGFEKFFDVYFWKWKGWFG